MCEGKTGNQERNIMIMFLSNLHYFNYKKNDDGSQTVNDDAHYMIHHAEPGEKIISCVETNEAPLKDVLATLGDSNPLHAVFYFATKKVRAKKTLIYSPTIDGQEYVHCSSEADFFWRGRVREITKEEHAFTESTKLIPIDFNEDNEDPVGVAISAVTTLEKKIKEYLRDQNVLSEGEFPLKNCKLYVDITGGMRTANMVMSAAMQLLGYEGAELMRVVYSDFDRDRPPKKEGEKPIHPVSNVQPINDMYQLVAGVDAFKKYGSSAALSEYFKDIIDDNNGHEPLKKLLSAMNNFSESVLLCQTNTIRANVKELMDALHVFVQDENPDRPAKVELLAQMTEELERVYSPMFPDMGGEPDDIEIIQWCVNNSLIQQALTLCTEWLPAYLEDHGAVYTDIADIQCYCMGNKDQKDDTLGKKYFLMNFLTAKQSEKTIHTYAIRRATQYVMTNVIPARVAKSILPEAYVNNLAAWLRMLWTDFQKMKINIPVENKLLNGFITTIVKSKNTQREKAAKGKPYKPFEISDLKQSDFHKTLETFGSNMDCCRKLFGSTETPILYRFGSAGESKKERIPKPSLNNGLWLGAKSRNAVQISRIMFAGNMIQTDLTLEEALEYIRGYAYIRGDIRNKINHASKDADRINLRKVQRNIDEYLKLLRKIRDKRHVHTGLWAREASK